MRIVQLPAVAARSGAHSNHNLAIHSGFVQRFTIGFRGPLCLASGFGGVRLSDFAIGASVGACITMSLQLTLVSTLLLPIDLML